MRNVDVSTTVAQTFAEPLTAYGNSRLAWASLTPSCFFFARSGFRQCLEIIDSVCG